MKVVIIEDEAPAFRRLQKILEELQPGIEILEVIDSVEESIKWLKNHSSPDLIFMDIQLSDGLSFEIFDQVKITSPVVFTTAFDEYMLRAFKVNSIDYLLKPIKIEDLSQSLKKYSDLKEAFSPKSNPDINELIRQIKLEDKKYKTRFLAKFGDKLVSIETLNIAYFQSRNSLVYLVTNDDKKYLLDHTLDELSQQLDPDGFFRANRQFLVHFPAIKAVHKYYKGKLLLELYIPTNEPLTVSSEKAALCKRWLGD